MTTINVISLVLAGLQTLIVIAAPILVTRRYRQAPSRALRFLMLGFWLILLASVVVPLIGTGLFYSVFYLGGFAARPISSPFETMQAVASILEAALIAAGAVSLAYGALRVRSRRPRRFPRSRGPFAREIEDLGIASLRPHMRFLRHWLLEDPSFEGGDQE